MTARIYRIKHINSERHSYKPGDIVLVDNLKDVMMLNNTNTVIYKDGDLRDYSDEQSTKKRLHQLDDKSFS